MKKITNRIKTALFVICAFVSAICALYIFTAIYGGGSWMPWVPLFLVSAGYCGLFSWASDYNARKEYKYE